jgi:carboxymethylenebutenolidase
MGKNIELAAADDARLGAYLTGPENATKGVVVLQEIFGVNDYIKSMADRFGAAGYKTIAPAMFDRSGTPGIVLGYGPDDRKAGMEALGKLPPEKSVLDIAAAAKALGVSSVGVVGYCWGGTLAWLAATKSTEFKAASCWYGGHIVKMKDAKPNCPVQMHFGENDGSIPMSDVDVIRAAQPEAEIYVYPGVGHGFGCDGRDSFSAEAYELAQQRTLELFKRYL